MLNFFDDRVESLIDKIIDKRILSSENECRLIMKLKDEQKKRALSYINYKKKYIETYLEKITKCFKQSPLSTLTEVEGKIGEILVEKEIHSSFFFLNSNQILAKNYLSLCKDLFVINNLILLLENKPPTITSSPA